MRRAVLFVLGLLLLSCAPKVVRQRSTPPPPTRERTREVQPKEVTIPPAQRQREDLPVAVPADPACFQRSELVAGECRGEGDCQYSCAPEAPRKEYGECKCRAGEVCEKIYGGAFPGARLTCTPGCAANAGACRKDEACRPSGRCEAVSCDDGFRCAAGGRCAPKEVGADAHGCAPAACNADTDCPCPSYCVLGRCQQRAGVCQRPRA